MSETGQSLKLAPNEDGADSRHLHILETSQQASTHALVLFSAVHEPLTLEQSATLALMDTPALTHARDNGPDEGLRLALQAAQANGHEVALGQLEQRGNSTQWIVQSFVFSSLSPSVVQSWSSKVLRDDTVLYCTGLEMVLRPILPDRAWDDINNGPPPRILLCGRKADRSEMMGHKSISLRRALSISVGPEPLQLRLWFERIAQELPKKLCIGAADNPAGFEHPFSAALCFTVISQVSDEMMFELVVPDTNLTGPPHCFKRAADSYVFSFVCKD